MDYFDKKKAEQDGAPSTWKFPLDLMITVMTAKKMASDHYGYKDEC